ncbi:HTH-type transcriptional regulator PuuR [Methylobacterium crusticola]|uniref:HTH-type transcriptional regulator PuuR n=1 Tax=Methylobacterium crusticola TaxID=1697972 RepID=A0ABQ4QYJ2_9HYPH|nr:cupin domain-containing protein [Methylobacterium crusticola]GJD50328.1 HTH-type transcriptional regulator PuuR [Methylobacterium crusticola]
MKHAGGGQGDGQAAADLAVGHRLRALRRARGLPLKAVAGAAGLSIGFLSQVERGLSSPSLRVLALIADVLGVGLAALFGEAPAPEPDPIVTRAGERAALSLWRSGIAKQLLTRPGAEGSLSLFLMHLEPGAGTGDAFFAHDGEEAGLVMEGRLVLSVEETTLRLDPGDSFRFASRRPHRYRNPSREERTVVLWVNSVPPARP